MKTVKTYEDYKTRIKEIDELIDRSTNRDDMIIFHTYIKLKKELESIYPEYEQMRMREV